MDHPQNDPLVTGEQDQADIDAGGDGIVYATSPEEAKAIRDQLTAAGTPLHGYRADK